MQVKDKNGQNILEIALKNKDGRMINTLVKLNSQVINEKLANVSQNHQSMMRKILALRNKMICRSLFENKNMPVSFFNQSVMIQDALFMIDQNNEDGYDILNLVSGPSLPDYMMEFKKVRNKDGSFKIKDNGLLDKIESLGILQYYQRFPKKVYLSNLQTNQHLCIDTHHAFLFSSLRLKLIDIWQIDKDGPKIFEHESDIDLITQGTKNLPLDISSFGQFDLQNLHTIIQLIDSKTEKDVPNLTKSQVHDLDKTVQILGLDKYRWVYFRNSRKGDQTDSIFVKNYVLNKGSVNHRAPEPKKDELISDAGINLSGAFRGVARYAKLGEITIPEDVIAIKSIEMNANLRDQEWGNEATVLTASIFSKNDSYASVYQPVTRSFAGYPMFKTVDSNNDDYFESNINYAESHQYDRSIKYDLFSTVTAGDKLVFLISCRHTNGHTGQCDQLEFKISYINALK